jgi:hypothetical protein
MVVKKSDIKIWRYMDLAKYLDMLETSSLYFSRSDQLNDPYEGSLSMSSLEIYKEQLKHYPPEVGDAFQNFRNLAKGWIFINCWHMNDIESTAMWKIYGESKGSIAIQSTKNKLLQFIPKNKKNSVGIVKYIDYQVDTIPEGSILKQFLYKRKNFEYEKELRALSFEPDITEDGVEHLDRMSIKLGKHIRIDLQNLIEKVYVAPTSQDWFYQLVQRITEKYGLNVEINKSKLDDKPVF